MTHQPKLTALAAADPAIAALVEDEAQRQHDKIRLIASENYVSQAVLEATGTVLTNKYSEGYAGKRYYEGQQFIDQIEQLAIERAKAAVRRRARERAAVLRLAGEPRRLPRLRAARRHRHGHGAARRRPPHARLERVGHRQVVPRRCATACARRPAASTSTRSATSRWSERPKLIFCGGTAIPRTIDFPAFAEIAEEVGAVLVADIAHIAGLIAGGAHPSPVGARRRHHDHHAQDPARPARRDDHVRGRAREADRQGGVPGPAGRPAQPHHRRHRGRAQRGGRSRVQDVRARRSSPTPRRWPTALAERGFDLVSGGTDNHLILIDLTQQERPRQAGRARRSTAPASS